MGTGLSHYEQLFYYYYCIIHIPITIAIDSSVVIPLKYHPAATLVNWHIAQNNDFLLYEKPNWLYWFVIIELLFQLPLFFYFIKGFRSIWNTNSLTKDDKVRLYKAKTTLFKYLRIYGINASFTSLVCIIVIIQRGYYPNSLDIEIPLSQSDMVNLVMVYLPTFIIPLRLCFV
ncbi:hypothetical protein HG535_0H02150 [Zygotorulaspora mrakii]|uniref:Efficient mitochondria targeting-associated protein 19 n=1 Tax=Zygotorulaspora mrakii TaxID=42260 RepID=A0A7H9B813_ZYGMR|nr:uncharacterized protein HG535_0H02150 [Zygotorulaspora mrakii]QLG74888.1 hypothetical protein HG535_0H02150 [Zygotorulaspora mrakii]